MSRGTFPADLFTFTADDDLPEVEHGSSMVLTGGIPDLPTFTDDFPMGVVRSDEEGLGNLDGFMQEAGVQDLDWLEVDEQDMERLPKSPHGQVVPELEQAWSRKGDHNERYEARDLTALRVAEEWGREDVSQVRQDRAHVAKVIQRAMRRSAAGHKLRALLREAVRAMEGDPQAQRALAAVEASHGLVGRVYIQASAYPGCATGKWSNEVKKHSAGARYVVKKAECEGCVRAQQGRCSVFNKKLVVKVPWKQARRLYAAELEATGRRVASEGDPRKALRAAFNAPAYQQEVVDGTRQVHVAPSQRVSLEESRAALAATSREREVVGGNRSAGKRLKKAQLHVVRMVKAGLLDRETAKSLVSRTDIDAETMLSLAERAANTGRSPAEFSGAQNRAAQGSTADLDEARAALAATKRASRKVQARFRPLLRWARQKMSEGLVGSDLNQLLRARWHPTLLRDAAEVLRSARSRHEGLSGMLYVDAAAYASSTGTKGCEEGALRHRANQLKHVLAMDRCQGCSRAAKRADGTPVCRVYNKLLTARAPTKNAKAYQAESLRVAEASDAEVTASYFAPAYDQAEFRLSNQFDESLDLNESSSPETLGEVLFGDGLVIQ